MNESHLQQAKAAAPRSSRRVVLARGPPHTAIDFPVVGIGASEGGLDAYKKFVEALPPDNGMSFILVQNLDPSHESMMVDLLAGQTPTTVRRAEEGTPLERDHLYIIPPGTYLSVRNGALHLTQLQARHGAHLPFDYLLNSLANEYGARAVCVVLSGTGADGSLGLNAIKAKGGYVVAQQPEEAGYDGMPRSAIATGAVDVVLPVGQIPEALVQYSRRLSLVPSSGGVPRVAELERALETTNEEYQSTNEELLTSKEELQSLNEELTALNSQLQETLERQRTTSNDLQNVLYSTDVATIFLDTDLNIRFFTPATKSLFSVIPGDIGRPLADLSLLAADGDLLKDARAVLRSLSPLEHEIEGKNGSWYVRRISPYRTQDSGVEGVVLTFADITERKHAADALEAAKRQAQLANVAKSRFLATASHDLRQPLQTLALLQEQLTRAVEGDKATQLVSRMAQTLGSMSGMLNTLLDINQIEAGVVRAEAVNFPINELLERLKGEFGYHAQALGLEMRMVPCGLVIHSDPRLLEQMIRNLLSNAQKYTRTGKVLLGGRRRGNILRIEIWDTGIGIPEKDHQAIFEEYHQLDHTMPERGRGLGLGLSIVQRLGNLLGHRVSVRSNPGRGSVFAIDVALSENRPEIQREQEKRTPNIQAVDATFRTGALLVIEDDPQLRDLLKVFLKGEGHYVAAMPDGPAALDAVASRKIHPDLILADYNLPNGMNGLEVSAKLREKLGRQIPVIVLTGDISTEVLRNVASHGCVQINKPVKVTDLSRVIQRLLPMSQAAGLESVTRAAATNIDPGTCVVFVVDDDPDVRDAMRAMLEEEGRLVETFSTCEAFLESYRPVHEACLLVDAYLPGMTGLELLQRLKDDGYRLPAIMITGNSDVSMAVRAMKAGASDFIEKPVSRGELLASIERALEQSMDSARLFAWREAATRYISSLTIRQREVMNIISAGHPNKNIAADLGISQRTVENHRATIMKKTASKSLPALARLALAATKTV